jgi:hypothetical protein
LKGSFAYHSTIDKTRSVFPASSRYVQQYTSAKVRILAN